MQHKASRKDSLLFIWLLLAEEPPHKTIVHSHAEEDHSGSFWSVTRQTPRGRTESHSNPILSNAQRGLEMRQALSELFGQALAALAIALSSDSLLIIFQCSL
jgi:hypothetical protein